jgi:hypothetical protein
MLLNAGHCIKMLRNLHLRTVSPHAHSKAAGASIVGCPILFIQQIRSYPPKLDAVSSNRHQRTRCDKGPTLHHQQSDKPARHFLYDGVRASTYESLEHFMNDKICLFCVVLSNNVTS